jgi:hypothetical protein
MKVEDIAKVCHEANRAFCQTLGDYSQPPWDEAPEWQRKSAIAGVKTIIENYFITPEDQHKCWFAHKVADGWTYGPEKDVDKKTHPCMKPYDELPAEQRIKDEIFGSIARILIKLRFVGE